MNTEKTIKLCHITTVHPVRDVRIFFKECVSAARFGYDTHLIVRHDRDETADGVKILALPLAPAKGLRRPVNMFRALKRALAVKADIYQFHDPELLIIGMLLKVLTRAKIIYDVHEDIRKQTLGKSWIAPWLRRPVAFGLHALESLGEQFFDAIIVAEDSYIPNFCRAPVVIYNYPILKEYPHRQGASHGANLIYVGAITRMRGAFEMIAAVELLARRFPDVKLYLIGQFFPASLEREVKERIARAGLEKNIVITGRMNYTDMFGYLQNADIGLAVLHPDGNYIHSLPTKMFEYMMLGKPVVVSHFPLWEGIVREAGCGVVVDPLAPEDIAEKVAVLITDEKRRNEMGENGRKAVFEKFNWSSEEEKLIACYRKLI
ncbi:MAG: glycosyltransferase family 4 protein [Candidatus Zhuqueibacterota bacterium]